MPPSGTGARLSIPDAELHTIMSTRRLLPLLSWLLGFFLVANIYLVPTRAQSPRALDLIGLGLGLWLVLRLLSGGVRTLPLIVLALLNLVPLCWGLYAYQQGLRITMLLSVRWLLAMPVGYVLLRAAAQESLRFRLLGGMWWGLVLNGAVLVLQYAGLEAPTIRLGLTAPDSTVVSIERVFLRMPGMHGHPNASAAVVSLVVPVGLYLYYQRRARLWVPLASLLILLVCGHVTSSRSPLLVAGLSFALAALTSRRFVRSAALLAGVMVVVLPLWLHFGPPGGRVRWEDTAHMSANTRDRLASSEAALDLAAGHWLGQGVEASQRELLDRVEVTASHNAFLQLAIVYGPAQGFLVLTLLMLLAVRAPWGIRPAWGLEALLAFQTCGLFCFEEHLNNPTFICLTTWLCLASVARLAESPAGRATAAAGLAPLSPGGLPDSRPARG